MKGYNTSKKRWGIVKYKRMEYSADEQTSGLAKAVATATKIAANNKEAINDHRTNVRPAIEKGSGLSDRD